jgi:hypothetical protein
MDRSNQSSTQPSVTCPACGAAVAGKFCSECGTPLGRSRCKHCDAEIAAGSRFCAECGAPVAAGAASTTTATGSPWLTKPLVVVSLAAVALVVIVVLQLGSRSGPASDSAPPRLPLAGGGGTAPDISSLTPRDRAARLYDRIMRLHQERKTDSVAFFAPMALASYAEIPDMDDDARYDMARVAMVAGAIPLARAQADTILRRDSTHLLGLLLGADVARAANNQVAASKLEATFVASAARERARNLPEYQAHSSEIESALARLGGPAKR